MLTVEKSVSEPSTETIWPEQPKIGPILTIKTEKVGPDDKKLTLLSKKS